MEELLRSVDKETDKQVGYVPFLFFPSPVAHLMIVVVGLLG